MTKKNKKKSRNWLLTIVLLVVFYLAVLLIGSPFIKSTVINYRSLSYGYKVNSELPKVLAKTEQIIPPDFNQALTSTEPKDDAVIGTVRIDSLELELPIFVGMTNQNLLFGTATMYPERDALIDNIVILGHHLGYQGKLFSPIVQAKEGETVDLNYLGEQYTYKISATGVVDETDQKVLANTTDDSGILTLITCDKPTETNQRFVVVAKLVATTNKNLANIKNKAVNPISSDELSTSMIRKKVIDWHFYLPIFLILVSLIIGTPLLFRLSK